MPPKSSKSKSGKKKSAATNKKGVIAVIASSAAEASIPQNEKAVVTATAGTKRGRADSVEATVNSSKKAKVDQPATVHEIINSDVEEVVPSKKQEPAKTREVDTAIKKELDFMKLILSYFTMPAMMATMDAINLPKTPRPDTLPESSTFILEELERRFKEGNSIEQETAAIQKIEQKYEAGEYIEDPDGFERIVRRRLEKVEEMTDRMSKMYLKDTIKQLGSYPMGGTNADLAAQVVGMLTYEAENKSKLVREYRIVKSVYRSCYGCCGDGDDSLDEGGSGLDEGDEDENW